MKIVRGFFGFIGRHFLNVRRWISYDFLKSSGQDVYRVGRQVFKAPIIEKPETFNEAMSRLKLSEDDLKIRYDSCRNTFVVFSVFASMLALYTLYLLFHGVVMGAILALVLTVLIGLHAFKYHFWMFQIKNKKLGCSFTEWKSSKVNNNNKN